MNSRMREEIVTGLMALSTATFRSETRQQYRNLAFAVADERDNDVKSLFDSMHWDLHSRIYVKLTEVYHHDTALLDNLFRRAV